MRTPHLAAEPLIHSESRRARADPVQRPDPGLLIGRTELREHRLQVRRAGWAAVTSSRKLSWSSWMRFRTSVILPMISE
jgi:hypothetical protein